MPLAQVGNYFLGVYVSNWENHTSNLKETSNSFLADFSKVPEFHIG